MRRMLDAGDAKGSERVFKSLGALSFNAGKVTGTNAPALGAVRTRPTPESVWDFNVQKTVLRTATSRCRQAWGRQGTGPTPTDHIELILEEGMKKTILVVTNNLLTYEALYRAFRGAKCEVLLTVNLRETVDHCRIRHFDLVVVDLDWPIDGEAGGREVVRHVSGVYSCPAVIVISGRSDVVFAMESLGVAAVAEKPVDVPALLATAYALMTKPTDISNNGSEHSGVPFRRLLRNTRAFRDVLNS
jgi:CheY-like chemotaxis protein